ncbi:hypothetical protein [Agreia bicolorata]|uniref:TIGR04222 domain-containing protein n=1 Tax=Agreia bicolorata TaxID=110935 RepID=A0ABR5CB30_9MICO|nr:hypothetical protein [Agreia bicolorata]KJC62849.1 hypothetical protein TZ00_18345 [Agreia bicolorata]
MATLPVFISILVGIGFAWRAIRNGAGARQLARLRSDRLGQLRTQKENPRYRPHYFELLNATELKDVVVGRKPLVEYMGDARITDLSVLEARAIAGVALAAGRRLSLWATGTLLVGSVGVGAYIVSGLTLPGSEGPIAEDLASQTPEYWALLVFILISMFGVLFSYLAERKREGAHTLIMWAAHVAKKNAATATNDNATPRTLAGWQYLRDLFRSRRPVESERGDTTSQTRVDRLQAT